jgi:pre-60S factor REI1
MSGLACYTAPGVTFSGRDELQEHYRSDWHRYNLKRKVANLLPVRKEDFERRRDEALAMANAKKVAKTAHLKSGKAERKAEKKLRAKKDKPTKQLAGTVKAQNEGEAKPAAQTSIFQPEVSGEDAPVVADMDAEAYPEVSETPPEIDLRDSIFDNYRSEDMEANLVYMHKNFGFFLPDAEYLTDPEGMLEWCSKKVKHGRLCLCCGRMFKGYQACQQHMIDSSHCKLAYDDDEDLEEFEDFYDYSPGWDEFEDEVAEDDTKMIAEALGDDEEGGWETASDDDEDMEDGEVAKGQQKEGKPSKVGGRKTNAKVGVGQSPAFHTSTVDGETYEKKKKIRPKITVLDSGELLVTRGDFERRIGIKDLKRYYKQRYRPEEERDSVRCSTNERMKLLYKNMGQREGASAVARFNGKADSHSQALYIMKKMESKRTVRVLLTRLYRLYCCPPLHPVLTPFLLCTVFQWPGTEGAEKDRELQYEKHRPHLPQQANPHQAPCRWQPTSWPGGFWCARLRSS